jgi:GTPase SAR1 family protein
MDCNIRITCVGDGGVGKTFLLCTYADQYYPDSYIPTVFETFQGIVLICKYNRNFYSFHFSPFFYYKVSTDYKNEKYILSIHDTGGHVKLIYLFDF